MSLSGQFQQSLEALPLVQSADARLVAYSGGLDSHVLLHLCYAAGLPVRAVHIHHGLQAGADAWDAHCAEVCGRLDIDYQCIQVDAAPAPGESPEEAARNARYAAFADELQQGEVLLTAHHQDDQAETMLLQLMRSAGPAGLAAMPAARPFARGYHVRPLLGISRESIRAYAIEHQLVWIEDPSNADARFDRNYIRSAIMPAFRQNWPNASEALSQAAALQQDALEIIEAMAAVDLAAVAGSQPDSLSIARLQQLSIARQFNALRYWINAAGHDRPRRNILQEVIESVLPAADDAAPLVLWGNTEIRRYQDSLYILAALTSHEIHRVYVWDGEPPLYLDALDIEVRLEQVRGKGLAQAAVARGMAVRFRQGGEQIRPHGRRHTHSLKKLMQEAGIPPWQRNRIPLIYIDHELACVCGYWVAEAFAAGEDQQGWCPVCDSVKRR